MILSSACGGETAPANSNAIAGSTGGEFAGGASAGEETAAPPTPGEEEIGEGGVTGSEAGSEDTSDETAPGLPGEGSGEELGDEAEETGMETGDAPCLPACADLACGPDGCGGSCGECGEGQSCLQGACTHDNPFCEPCAEPGALPPKCTKGALCSSDGDCFGAGVWSGVCLSGVCQFEQAPCASAEHCRELCIQNQGESWPVVCGTHAECVAYFTNLGVTDGAQYCQNTQEVACEPGMCGGAAVCVQYTACAVHADCPEGPGHAGKCVKGRCTFEAISCGSHAECVNHCMGWALAAEIPDPGEYCNANPGYGCIPSMCPPYTSQCMTFTGCASDADCLKAGAGVLDMACISGACANQGWLECTSGADCKASCEAAYGADAPTLCSSSNGFLCE